MVKKLLFNVFSVVALLMLTTSAMAHGTHYGKFSATTTGNGKVYVSLSETASPEWSESASEAIWNCNGSSGNDTKTGYFYAQPNEGYLFTGWYQGGELKGTTTTLSQTLKATSTNSGSPTTLTLEARFALPNIELSEIALTGEHLYLVSGDKYINKGADYGTRAIVTDEPMHLTITQDPNTKLVTLGTDSKNYIFDAGGYNLYTDNTTSGNNSIGFVFSGDNENGYKIYIPNDLNWALGWADEQIDANGANGNYTVLKLVPAAEAPLWKIGKFASVAINADAQYATFCAPFDVTLPDGVTASTVDAVEDGLLTLTAVEGAVPANTPVVLYAEAGLASTDFYGVSKAAGETATVGLLTGVYADTEINEGYVMQKQDKVGFYEVTSTKTVPAFHAYLTAPAGARFYGFGDETAIEVVEVVKAARDGKFVEGNKIVIIKNGVKYNAAGQRVK